MKAIFNFAFIRQNSTPAIVELMQEAQKSSEIQCFEADTLETLEEKKSEGMRQLIIVRKDLQMSPGKLAAQVSHASMAFIADMLRKGGVDEELSMDDRNAEKPVSEGEVVQMEKAVDGYRGFLFLDDAGLPLVAMHWEHRFNNMVNRYNAIYKEQMPNITPHVCRHTYCSNMAKAGMNPKTLQYLMGHSDITVTLDTYTHLGLEDAAEELKRLAEVEQARKEQEKLNRNRDEDETGTIVAI